MEYFITGLNVDMLRLKLGLDNLESSVVIANEERVFCLRK